MNMYVPVAGNRRVWVAILEFSATLVSVYVVCRLARESMWSVQEIVKTPKREHRARPYRILLISLRADKLTEVVVVEFLLSLQPHGHVAYCSFTRWLHVSRHEFQYVAPTHNDAA